MKTNFDIVNLIDECLKGDRAAQKQLYDMYRVRLFTVCLRYFNDKVDAEDRFQEGWIKVFSNLTQFKSDRGTFYSWARKVFVNTCLEYLRKRKMYVQDIDDTFLLPIDHQDVHSDLSVQEMVSILQTLPTGYRTIFNLYVIEGYTHKEIAEQLDISVSTSKTQLMKAKAIMREKVSIAFAV